MEDEGTTEAFFLSCEACSSTPMLTEVIRRGEAHYRVVAECNCGETTEIPATVFIYAPSSWTLQDGTPVRSVLPEEVQRELRGKDFDPEILGGREKLAEVESTSDSGSEPVGEKTSDSGVPEDDAEPVMLESRPLRCVECGERGISKPSRDESGELPEILSCPSCGNMGEVVPDRSSSSRDVIRVKGFEQYDPSKTRTSTQKQDKRGRGVSTGEFDDLGDYL